MRHRVSTLMAVTVLLGTVGYVVSLRSAVAAPTGPAASSQSVPAVESLYAQDLVARVNAEHRGPKHVGGPRSPTPGQCAASS